MKDVIEMDTLGREMEQREKELYNKKTRLPRIVIGVILALDFLVLFGAGLLILNTTAPFLSLIQPGFGNVPIATGSALLLFATIGLIGFWKDSSLMKALGSLLTLLALAMFLIIGVFYLNLLTESESLENGEFSNQESEFGQKLNDIAFAALDACCGEGSDFNLTCGATNSSCVVDEDFRSKAEDVIIKEDLCDLLQDLGLEFDNNGTNSNEEICDFEDAFDFIVKFGETVKAAAKQAVLLFFLCSIFAMFATMCTFGIDARMSRSLHYSRSRAEKKISQISQPDPTKIMASNEIDQRAFLTANNL